MCTLEAPTLEKTANSQPNKTESAEAAFNCSSTAGLCSKADRCRNIFVIPALFLRWDQIRINLSCKTDTANVTRLETH